MKAPILDVERAIKHVPNFAKNVPICVSHSIKESKPRDGLMAVDVAVIKIYTANCDVYKFLNQALRTEQLKTIEPWFPYRGEYGDRSHLYKPGSIVTWVLRLFKRFNIIILRFSMLLSGRSHHYL